MTKRTSLATTVKATATYYHKKCGHNPDLCMGNLKMLSEKPPITTRSYQPILPRHL